jgi:hypothetical protein
MRPRIGYKKLAAAGAAAAVGVASTIALTSGSASASPAYGYSGFGAGTYVFTGLADSGPQVLSPLGCTRKVGHRVDNDSATANVNRQAIARTVKTESVTHNDARGDGTTSTAKAAEVKLGTLLKVVGVDTYARAVNKNGQFETSGDTKFAGIKIGNVTVPTHLLTPKANTKLGVPGLGFIVLNWQTSHKGTEGAWSAAAAVLIHSTVKNQFLPKGATVAVGLAKAEVGGPANALVRGQAYGTQVKVGNLVKSSPTSLQYTCMGTGGREVEVGVANVTVPNLAKVRGVNTTKYGKIGKGQTTVWFDSKVAGAQIGSGATAIKVGAVTSRAVATKVNGQYRFATDSRVLSLVVGNRVIPVPQAPNKTIDIVGIASITFNKVVRHGNNISVTALVINIKGLNTTVNIAHSEAGIVG